MAALVVFLVLIGVWIRGRWDGVFIDQHNRISLSRFQITIWTGLILPAIAGAAIANLFAGQPHPLDLHIPQPIWVALGIATTSVVGSPLLQASKTDPSIHLRPAQTAKIHGLAGIGHEGLIVTKANVSDASWGDLFAGEEVDNYSTIDVARVQMFFFTLVLVAVYAAALASTFWGAESVASFPDFDSSMSTLLGISNAGYLLNKAVPHT